MCTTLAAFLIGYSVQQLSNTDMLPGSFFAMSGFAFSPLIWQYAVTSEVFPLNTFFTSLLIFLTFKYSITGKLFYSILGAFVSGLALCNQHTIILFELPFILWILFLQRNSIRNHQTILVLEAVAFITGISIYVYLPISATLSPQDGSWGNVSSLQGFLHHFLRKDYGTFQLFSGASGVNTESMLERTYQYIKDFTLYQGYYGVYLFFTVIGVVLCCLPNIHMVDVYKSYPLYLNSEDKNLKYAKENGFQSKLQTASTAKNVLKGKKKSEDNQVTNTQSQERHVVEGGIDIGVYQHKLSLQEAAFTPAVLFASLVFYLFVFHSLSNLPLDNRLLYGVHQRFWMQPNVLLFIFAGLGLNCAVIKWYDLVSFIRKVPKSKKGVSLSSKKNLSEAHPLRDGNTDEGGREERGTVAITTTTGVIGSYRMHQLSNICGYVLAILVVALHINKWYDVSDQSDGTYFHDYAKSILDPLPVNSLLLINYDQQWTSIRYLQKCEKVRQDVVTINLSMMTYPWFKHKTKLYSDETNKVYFPLVGHLASEHTPAHLNKQGFILSDFLHINIDKRPIFLGGKITVVDSNFVQMYEHVPFGMVSQISRANQVPNATVYSMMLRKSWEVNYIPKFTSL